MIAEQVTLLNETTLQCLNETDETKIVSAFCRTGLTVLKADFGFVWLNSSDSPELKLVYKSPRLPFKPNPPRQGGRNYRAIQSSTPDYIHDTSKTPDATYVSKFVKSFVIIPLVYKDSRYGSMVFCFKKPQAFEQEKKTLCVFIGNSVAQTITINRLISEERLARERSEMQRLLQQERLKVKSIADANHELRTPIAIIKGNVDLAMLEKDKLPASVQATFKAIDGEVKHLTGILSDLALLTPEAEHLQNERYFEKLQFSELVADVVARCAILAKKKNIKLKLSQPKQVLYYGSPVYLEKLIVNLVKNSIVYGRENGRTDISVKQTTTYIAITVADNGIGIGKEDLPHIFERFYRADPSRGEGEKGTGLGLAIVKKAVELHGGEISVKSSNHKGSVFTVVLPITRKIK